MSATNRIRNVVDRIMGGRGEHSITVPVMDGALKPNNYLEQATVIASIESADNLVDAGGRTLLSSANRLVELNGDGSVSVQATYEADITCLCVSPNGHLAVGLDGKGITIVGGPHDGKRLAASLSGQALNCPTAAVFLDEDTLAVCNGSSANSALAWSRDLLSLGRTGSVVMIDLATEKARLIRGGMAFPAGIAVAANGKLVISEAWKHRLLMLSRDDSSQQIALPDLPAYPSRIVRSREGGYWLAMFAVRSQLQEFVLREDRYRHEMMATIDPEYWIAPALSSGGSFKEPLQAGSVIRLGIHKPWAPTRSYGLLLRLDDNLQPVWSAHSRADGSRHGVTTCLESEGRLLVASKGLGTILAVDHLALTEPDDMATQVGSVA